MRPSRNQVAYESGSVRRRNFGRPRRAYRPWQEARIRFEENQNEGLVADVPLQPCDQP